MSGLYLHPLLIKFNNKGVSRVVSEDPTRDISLVSC
jgi:hypothetical protein